MRRSLSSLFVLLATATIVISCGDNQPTATRTPGAFANGECIADLSSLQSAASGIFHAGSTTTSIHGQLDDIQGLRNAGRTADAQAKARELVQFIRSKASEAPGRDRDVDNLANGILCWAGLAETTYLVKPSDSVVVLTSNDGGAGVLLPPTAVTQATVITITVTDGDLLTADDTKLDRYPRSVSVSSSVPVGESVVGVCLTNIPASVLPRLRMGHRTRNGFKIEPPAPVDFLNCPGAASSASAQRGVSGFFKSLAQFVLPKPLYARQELGFASGGVGGTAGEYSPFEPIDPALSFSGGVGGTAGEYIRAQGSTVSGGVCIASEAPVSSPLEPECRPRVEVRTANGTLLENVPVSWLIAGGGGLTASEDPVTRVCGIIGPSAANATNANGKAGACWTLGAVAGPNTLTATVTAGGDAPPGVTFLPAIQTFTANALRLSPIATAVGENVSYDGLAHPGLGTCSSGLTPVLSYSGDGTVPRNVGSYLLTVTCGAGSANTSVATANATITIGPAAPNIAITCPVSVVYTSTPRTPCTATLSAPGLSLTPAPTYAANTNAGIATATVTYAGGGNVGAASSSRTFLITPVPATATAGSGTMIVGGAVPTLPCAINVIPSDASSVTCTTTVPVPLNLGANVTAPAVPSSASANYTVSLVNGTLSVRFAQVACLGGTLSPSVSLATAGVRKGFNVLATCALQNAQGAAIIDASGNLVVEDLGASGLAAPVAVMSEQNVFTLSQSVYSYKFTTIPAGFIVGHYYRVAVSWNDGSTSTGYFHLVE